MAVRIRECAPADAPSLALVGQATFLETYADVLPVADILAHCEHEHGLGYYRRLVGEPGYGFWVAESEPGDAPVGYSMVAPPDLPVPLEPGDLELKRIYLLHRFHGSGVGGALLDVAVQGARAAGASRLLLGVYGQNLRALAFYARQGFVQAGVRKFRVGANEYDDLVLARPL